jgi:hypothetical protein
MSNVNDEKSKAQHQQGEDRTKTGAGQQGGHQSGGAQHGGNENKGGHSGGGAQHGGNENRGGQSRQGSTDGDRKPGQPGQGKMNPDESKGGRA